MTQIIGDLAWLATIPGIIVLVCAAWFGFTARGES